MKAPTAPLAGDGLIVLDDFFPNLLSGFRVAEFVHYLRMFGGLRVICTTADFDRHHADFAAIYPDLAKRVVPWTDETLDSAKAASLVFLNNAAHWQSELEKRGIPFVFTLYPGGGFHLNDPASQSKLERLLASPMLRGIVITQPITRAELERLGCTIPVTEIQGVVVNPAYLAADRAIAAPGALRLCFVAFRYDEGGRSKGFPEFIAAATSLAQTHRAVRFAVVGNFGPDDWPIPDALRPRLTFHGALSTMQLRRFFHGQDVIVSPSRRYAITESEFDGFPTGACVEASLCGVAVLSSDELCQNRHYVDGEEILISPADSSAIVARLRSLADDPGAAFRIGQRGRLRTIGLYGPEQQLIPRTRLLRRLAAHANIAL